MIALDNEGKKISLEELKQQDDVKLLLDSIRELNRRREKLEVLLRVLENPSTKY